MPKNNFLGPRWSQPGLREIERQARGLLAQFDQLAAEVESYLADPEDLRPVDGAVAQRVAEGRGLPGNLRRFDREAAERTRDEFTRMLEVAYQTRATIRR